MRVRKFVAAGFAAALLCAGAIAVAPVAQAGLPATVDPGIPDGDADSLRDVLENQVTDGDTVVLEAGATYTLDSCGDGDISIDAAVTIEGNGATIQQTCSDRIFSTADDLTIRNATITGGDGFGEGGAIDADGFTQIVLEGVWATNNASFNDGGVIDIEDGDLTVVDSVLSGNRSGGDGGAIDTSEGSQFVTIVRSTLAGNCSESSGGALSTQGNDEITIVNSTVTQNTSADSGAIDATSSNETVTLVYSDIVANTVEEEADCGTFTDSIEASDTDDDAGPAAASPDGANIDLSGESEGTVLRAFGTVIAQPTGAGNCGTDPGTTIESSGYNYSDDDSCGLTDSTDQQNAADPQLGSLANNGGPTPTLLPALTSPLVDAIPTAACSGGDALAQTTITTDQRLLVRPDVVSQTCDIGSVELQTEAVALEPNFTG